MAWLPDYPLASVGVDWGKDPSYSVIGHTFPLDIVKIRKELCISRPLEYKAYFHDVLESAGREIMLAIEVELASTFPTSHAVRYPLDWVQAFKERWAPKWFTDRWPVVYKTHVITARMLFPNLPPPKRVGEPIVWWENQQ
jgi:hypothetical protein